jgi:Holliday junction resolvase-like predicted endonuclease
MSKRTLKSRNCEARACSYLARNGWTEIHHNLKCAHVQLDIVARSPAGTLTIVEVKMQSGWGMAHVPARQAERLLRAAAYLAQAEPVQILIAFTSASEIRLLPFDSL